MELSLTDPAPFAPSPFQRMEHQQECDADFITAVPDMAPLLDAAVNRNCTPFKDALLILIDKTRQHIL